jgi:hypothetical protein
MAARPNPDSWTLEGGLKAILISSPIPVTFFLAGASKEGAGHQDQLPWVFWGSQNAGWSGFLSSLQLVIRTATHSIALDIRIFFVFAELSICLQSVNLQFGGPLWRDPSKCASLTPRRMLLFLLGVGSGIPHGVAWLEYLCTIDSCLSISLENRYMGLQYALPHKITDQ